MTQNVRLQNLRDFTVQIRNADDQIVGTGIAVSTNGRIVTCAHVVRAAGIDPRKANGAEIGVYFPQARGGEEKNRKAVVERFFPDNDDDVVLLQLTSGASPLAPEQIAIVGTADESATHAFRSYGYRALGTYPAGWADGTIMGSVDSPPKLALHVDPVQLDSKQIAPGMSGSGVLDVERNLLIGIISETYYPPGDDPKDRDTAWSVNARVLSIPPLELSVQDVSLALKAAPEPKFDKEQAEAAVFIKEKYSWNNAPAVLTEWTGRDDLLKQITDDWNNSGKHVTSLIGFGGEGKSSLARKWIDSVIASTEGAKQSPRESEIASGSTLAMTKLDGLFWWGFYENRSVDEFLEAALKYMSGGKIDPRQVQSSNLRAQIIGAMLGAGRYFFVLDGLEVMQHQEGDQYGLLQSNDLRDLLTFFARPDNQSFCLITSRAPLLDLMEYTTYTHRDVDRLSEEDGRILLRRLGVQGSDAELNQVVADWDGHALTLSILVAYLAERYQGDIHHLADIPIPTADEPRYERVHRVLRRYDDHLSKEEREFLKLFSVFRLPVKEDAFEKVFNPLLKSLDKDKMQKLVSRLANYRLIRHDEHEKAYTTHPLIRNHYFAIFTKGDYSQEIAAHAQIKDYYLSIAGDTPQYPTLDDLKPLIEVVHHACQAGAYDEAWKIYWERISQQTRFVLAHQLGSYETELILMQEFFINGDTSQEVQGNNPNANKRYIPSEIGQSLMVLGRLREAVPFYERVTRANFDAEDWLNTSISYGNLADLFAHLGQLDESARSARQALDIAPQAGNKWNEGVSNAWQGWVEHLRGNMESAASAFIRAEALFREDDSGIQFLYSVSGIQHADYMHRTNQSDYARRVTEANLQICEKNHFAYTPGMCHRVLGDLDVNRGNYDSARIHYDTALKRARSESVRYALIEALLARGRFLAKHIRDANAAFSELNEALGYCVESGYRRYEADVRVALAWAYLANDEKEKAKQSVERALQMSNEMGYHWGKVDAEEVLAVIARSGEESKPSRRVTPAKTKKASKPINKRRGNPK